MSPLRNAATLLVFLSAASCSLNGSDTPFGQGSENVYLPADLPLGSASDGEIVLAGLHVAPRPAARSDYRRMEFGGRWVDIDGNGCNQRDDVLLRDAEPGSARVRAQGRCDHDVLAGRWVDPYTGREFTLDDLKVQRQAQSVQVDHIVSLAEAWVSGARSWTTERRQAFANDPDGLVASDRLTNASKGSSDPAAWRPRAKFQCSYSLRWIEVKARWALDVDPSEVAALGEMLDTCMI